MGKESLVYTKQIYKYIHVVVSNPCSGIYENLSILKNPICNTDHCISHMSPTEVYWFSFYCKQRKLHSDITRKCQLSLNNESQNSLQILSSDLKKFPMIISYDDNFCFHFFVIVYTNKMLSIKQYIWTILDECLYAAQKAQKGGCISAMNLVLTYRLLNEKE